MVLKCGSIFFWWGMNRQSENWSLFLKHLQEDSVGFSEGVGAGASGAGAGRQRTVNRDVSLLSGYRCSCLLLLTSPTLHPART